MAPSKLTLSGIYNPANRTKDELIANFVVRLKELQDIIDVLKTDEMKQPPRHFMIRGRRGMGKTTLLLRLYHAVNDDAELNQMFVPVIFDEEQYRIRTLYKLWEEIALSLEEKEESLFSGIYNEMQAYNGQEDYEERCYDILITRLDRKGKQLVLLVDNFGDMLAKFQPKERQRLREVLLLCMEIRVIGASAVALEFQDDHPEPLFGFFKEFRLEGLTHEETMDLLLQLGKTYEIDTVRALLDRNPGKVEALRRLTGGVPRTIILLFELFLDNESKDIYRDLEAILDRITPFYKHCMDGLPPQEQEIIDTIALKWDAVGVTEISKKTGIPAELIVTQLDKLEKNDIVTRVPTSTDKSIFQLSDRFFNIWYLMRNGRKRERQKVMWLMRFLDNWCDKEELSSLAEKHIRDLKTGNVFEKHAFYMTEALVAADIPSWIQDEMLTTTKDYLAQKESTFAGELSPSFNEQFKQAVTHYENREYDAALKKFLDIKIKNHVVYRWLGFLHHRKFNDFEEAEKYYLPAVAAGDIKAMGGLAILYLLEKKNSFEALRLTGEAFVIKTDAYTAGTYAIMLLWNNEIKSALRMVNVFIQRDGPEKLNQFFEPLLMFLLAKKQYDCVLTLFRENKFNIRDRYKPLYYALMVLLKDTYPDEHKKMGPELAQTVEEIVHRIGQIATDYA